MDSDDPRVLNQFGACASLVEGKFTGLAGKVVTHLYAQWHTVYPVERLKKS